MARRIPTRIKTAAAEPSTTPALQDATIAIRAAIRAHVPDAIRELARLAREASSEQARVSAINALIDRGYGDLKHTTDADEIPGLTVRFVNSSDKP